MSKITLCLAGLVAVLSAVVVVLIVEVNSRANARTADLQVAEQRRVIALDQAEQKAQADLDALAAQHHASEQALSDALAQLAAIEDRNRASTSRQRDQIGDLEQMMAHADRNIYLLRDRLAERDVELVGLRAAHNELAATHDFLQASLEAAAAKMQEQDLRIDAYRRARAAFAIEKEELAQSLVLTITQRNRYADEVRLLTERLAAMTVLVRELEDQWPHRPPDEDTPDPADDPDLPQLDGVVTGVEKIQDGLILVEIDLGPV